MKSQSQEGLAATRSGGASSGSEANNRRRVSVTLATLLVANPAILFLLTRSVFLALAVPAMCIGAMDVLLVRLRWTLASAYLFNAIAVISIFAHAEAILLHGFPDYVIENLYTIEDGYYFNRPLLDQTFNAKEYSVRYVTNTQGFRVSQEQNPANIYTRTDWLVIGDSFTQGAQVDYSQLYTTLLNRRFPNRIVVNAGISGLGLGHEYRYFEKAGHKLDPDLVILQLSSFNDFTNIEPRLVGFTDRLMTHSAFVRFLLADFKFTNPASLPLGRWTEPFHPDPQSNTDSNIFYKRSSPTKTRDLTAFENYLTRLRDAVSRHGSKLLVVLIPTKEQVHQRYFEEVLREFSINPADLDMARPNNLLAELTRILGIDFLDLLPVFKAAEASPFFDYDEHMSPAGHALMAEALAERVGATYGSSEVRLLSDTYAAERYPALSQDGALLSYQAVRDGSMELFLATADLRERRRLTYNDVNESHPTLSKDNSLVLFTQGSPEHQRTEVVIMKLDGSQRRLLTSEPNVFGAIPTFSRSNLQIAYAEWTQKDASSALTLPRIVVLDAVAGVKRYITPADRESWRPVFAPDAKSIYYISKPDQQFDLYCFDLLSGTERRLTHTPFDEWDPQVSPTGHHLIYAAREAGNWDLFLMDVANGAVQRLTNTKGDEWDPSISPGGATILFAGRFGVREANFTMPFPR